MDAEVGLAIQSVGVVLVTLLSFFMMQSIPSTPVRYWTIAWASLSLGLISLFMGFKPTDLDRILFPAYFLGEYIFGFMFAAGCRNHATGWVLRKRHLLGMIPGVIFAIALSRLSSDFNNLFVVHALVMSGFFSVCFVALRSVRGNDQARLGSRVMSVALFLLALDFLHYVPVFGNRSGAWGLTVPVSYLQYTSIFDLILEMLLGFGTVMVLMEGVRNQVETANGELRAARDRLELIARMDPMTKALNRHAFHSLVNGNSRENRTVSGCVAVIDINNLKPINDSIGHAAGDRAIRSVATAVRSIIRADDMLFRWGGDEFLLLMFGICESEARNRLESLNLLLSAARANSEPECVEITVSHGLAFFSHLAELEEAVDRADKAMYARKQVFKDEQVARH